MLKQHIQSCWIAPFNTKYSNKYMYKTGLNKFQSNVSVLFPYTMNRICLKKRTKIGLISLLNIRCIGRTAFMMKKLLFLLSKHFSDHNKSFGLKFVMK